MAAVAIFNLKGNWTFNHACGVAVIVVVVRYIRRRQFPRKATATILDGDVLHACVVHHFRYAEYHLFDWAVVDVFFDATLAGIRYLVASVNKHLNVFLCGEGYCTRTSLTIRDQSMAAVGTVAARIQLVNAACWISRIFLPGVNRIYRIADAHLCLQWPKFVAAINLFIVPCTIPYHVLTRSTKLTTNWIELLYVALGWMKNMKKICEDRADLGQNVSQIGGTNEILVAQTARIALAIEECYVRYEVVQFIIAILPEISCNQ